MIMEWLRAHTLLSRSALCTRVGVEYKMLENALDGKSAIPAKHLDAFEKELAEYGYKKPEIGQ